MMARHEIGLGTLDVRGYTRRWLRGADTSVPTAERLTDGLERVGTAGPGDRFRAVLFIEKEGFNPLLKAIQLADRFDVGICSTKGMSVTAMRQLIEHLSEAGVTTFVLHDFDKSGFSILHTLHSDTRRYRFRTSPLVVDLGLRLEDVREMGLDSEPVEYDGKVDPRVNLRESGATEAECEFPAGPGLSRLVEIARASRVSSAGHSSAFLVTVSSGLSAAARERLKELDIDRAVVFVMPPLASNARRLAASQR
jgi:Protein of unknown function C-terminus (DUF2399)